MGKTHRDLKKGFKVKMVVRTLELEPQLSIQRAMRLQRRTFTIFRVRSDRM